MLCVKFSNLLQIHHQYEWNLFTVKTYLKKYQNESGSYYDKGNKNEQSTIYEHLSLCTHYSHIADLFKIDTNSFNSSQFNVSQAIILDRRNIWNVLLFKEALMIKKHRPTLDCGLMASKELQLFWLHFNDFIQHPIYSFNIKLIILFLTF